MLKLISLLVFILALTACEAAPSRVTEEDSRIEVYDNYCLENPGTPICKKVLDKQL